MAINLKNILNYSIKFIFILIFFAKNIEIFIYIFSKLFYWYLIKLIKINYLFFVLLMNC
ncbi:putative membrane protein [Acinetobacter baumannii 532279]|nr:putative membrane protein [Acinetobacter baumannii 532279]